MDDDRAVLTTLSGLLQRHGFQVVAVSTAAAAWGVLCRESPAVVLLDLGLPDGEGLELLTEFREERPETVVIVLTAHDSLDNAIEAIKRGAFHFLAKPYVPEELVNLIRRALEERQKRPQRSEDGKTEGANEAAGRRPLFVGRAMKELEQMIAIAAPSDANILLTGESGVGKEVMANWIHQQSRRAGGPMVRLNCAALPSQLIEGELFGYMKGAFTGAVNDFPGMIAEAAGGTLFLDEIIEMPVELQTRFLRVLQEREYRPLGSTKTLKADFRLITATNRPVQEAIRQGLLRTDLFYRINTFQLEIPPLRKRPEAIPALVEEFTRHFAEALGKPVPTVGPEVMAILMDYHWPGNIRELQNAMEYAVILSQEARITEKELPPEILLPPALRPALEQEENTLDLDIRERDAILSALAKSHGNKKKAAELLGIHRPTLYSKMKRYNIQL